MLSKYGTDAVTIACIGVLAYMLGNVLHEVLGHGGACLISGEKPLVVSTVHLECSVDKRLVMAGGTLVNFIAGAVFFVLGRMTGRAWPRLKYFFWLSMAVNLFTATGYFLFSGIGGVGDWALFIEGLGAPWAWRIGMTVLGAVGYTLAAWLVVLEVRPLVGSDKDERYRRAKRLSWIPYFAGGTLACIAGSLNPQGMILVAMSAAASTFGGTSGFLWAMKWLNGDILLGPPAEPLSIERSWVWIVTACVAVASFIALLGPGWRFSGK